MALVSAVALVAVLAQQPAGSSEPDLAVISARLGPCAADFTVKDADGAPVYAAIVHVRIRYGLMSLKRMDLEVGTNGEGKARVEGLPDKAKPLTYEISKTGRTASVEQNLAVRCHETYDITLK